MEAIFWDWHGVLGMQRYWQRPTTHREQFDALQRLVYGDMPRDPWMRGEVTTPELARRSGGGLPRALLAEQLYAGFEVDEFVNVALFSAVAALHPGAAHWVVTDNVDVFSDFLASLPWFQQRFRGLVNSVDHGVLKSDSPGLFEIALERADVAAADVLFLDDSAENCQRFRALGGHAITVDRVAVP